MGGKRPGFGKQLADLHRWNGWIVLILAVTGLLLAWDVVRGWLNGEARNPIKQLHIVLGIISAVLIVLYIPLMRRHLKQIKQRPRQKGNLAFVLILLIGWFLSGIVLWQLRRFPPEWANTALLVHDLLTWIAVPYLVYHSVTRIRWLKQPHRRSIKTNTETATSAPGRQPFEQPSPWINRRQFLKWSLGAVLAVTAVPPFFRWLAKAGNGFPAARDVMDTGENPNMMLPEPVPLPDSVNVIGGGAQGHFRPYTVTPFPHFDSKTWSFTVNGLVDNPAKWNWEQFLALARTVQVSDFHCVTGWSVYKNTWEGIPLSALLQQAGVQPKAQFVKFYSGDGVYTDALSLEQANMKDVMVAVLHDGKPIHRDYGGPVRLIVPTMYAYKSVKWLERIELIEEEHIGYWEERGYDNDAWIKT